MLRWVTHVAMAAALAITLVTAVQYVRDAVVMRRDADPADERAASGRREPTARRASWQRRARRAALRAGQTVATAESLTGGLVCATLVDVPGASDVVRGGVVAYLAETKIDVLGVDADLIERAGTVDADVAAQMAEGAGRVWAPPGEWPRRESPARTRARANRWAPSTSPSPGPTASTTRELSLPGDREARSASRRSTPRCRLLLARLREEISFDARLRWYGNEQGSDR